MASDQLLAAARGDIPADLVLRNARLVNVFSGEIESTDVAIAGDRIAGIGAGYAAREAVDLQGAYVAPGLIDGHVHIESSLCLPPQFAAAVVPRGVTTAVTDPHEIANVCGAAGVRFMADASKGLPLRVITNAPSCVPATDMATTGAKLTADDLQALLRDGVVYGLAEVMNFPGVISADASVAAKLELFHSRVIDGHAPGVGGKQLNAYVAAGVGSDHECVTVNEAWKKLARGMYVLIREATNAQNLGALLPLITPTNSRRIGFCTDDRTPPDLLRDGSIDMMLRRAIASGVDPVTAIRCCSLNTAEWFRLHDRGGIAPGQLADLFVFRDLNAPSAERVYTGGHLVAENGRLITEPTAASIPNDLLRTCHVTIGPVAFRIAARGQRIRVIGSLRDQLITEHRVLDVTTLNGQAVADPSRDLLKMAVIDRHNGGRRIGLGFIQGIGLARGAMAGTFAHDHHNLVVIGCDDASMTTAARAVAAGGGGLAVASGDQVVAALALPVAGLMSDRPIGEVAAAYEKLLAAARELGSPLHDPFMAMSFMALEVIPSLKLTDQGLVDVDAFRLVDLFV
ncbi:MAG: adenine deaminase [Tepidisphaeraceae bacterium]